ncbi:hypothetical protein Tco_1133148 [Tanacetum coccineum]|uniref:RNase H type-1 domain-containing protein n=1 Tax=Tanacetum coccineum TaxID=301880 RepID=A0ABQ5JDW2_9ASTR
MLSSKRAEWEIFMMLLWGLWTRRNKRFHGQLNGREGNVKAVAKFVLLEHHMANQRETTSTLHNTHTGVWLRPEIDLIKVNRDAAWKKESGKAGLGLVARDHNGEVGLSDVMVLVSFPMAISEADCSMAIGILVADLSYLRNDCPKCTCKYPKLSQVQYEISISIFLNFDLSELPACDTYIS